MELFEGLLARRSGRVYNGSPVPREALNSILEAGLLAPSSRNRKNAAFITVSGRETMLELARVKKTGAAMLKTADCAIAVIGDTTLSDTWIEDTSVSMTYMMLRATDLGIANCWVHCRNRESSIDGVSSEQFVRELFGIPRKYGVLAILALGMTDEPPQPHRPEEADFSRVRIGKY